MRRTLLLLTLLSPAIAAQAQTTSGKVTYEETVSMAAPDDLPAEALPLKDFFSGGMHFTRTLTFNSRESLYTSAAKEENKVAGSTDEGMQIQVKVRTPEEITYTNLQTGDVVAQRELMGRKFLVSGDATKRVWRMTGNQKSILNYPCQEAVSYGKDTITAWFTTAIPVSAGPQEWRGLPGLILEGVGIRGKESFAIRANKVEEGAAVAIAPPKEGKKVTEAEYEAIEKQKQKEMMEQYGGNGRMIIRMER